MKKLLIISLAIVLFVICGWYLLINKDKSEVSKYTFAEITRGNIETVISSSGTLEALSTIEVGTQVSVILSKLLVDFNDHVKKGELLAVLDTTTLAALVRDQRANLDRAEHYIMKQK